MADVSSDTHSAKPFPCPSAPTMPILLHGESTGITQQANHHRYRPAAQPHWTPLLRSAPADGLECGLHSPKCPQRCTLVARFLSYLSTIVSDNDQAECLPETSLSTHSLPPDTSPQQEVHSYLSPAFTASNHASNEAAYPSLSACSGSRFTCGPRQRITQS